MNNQPIYVSALHNTIMHQEKYSKKQQSYYNIIISPATEELAHTGRGGVGTMHRNQSGRLQGM